MGWGGLEWGIECGVCLFQRRDAGKGRGFAGGDRGFGICIEVTERAKGGKKWGKGDF